MHVVIAGGTGFLGTALIARLTASGHVVTVLTRDPARAQAQFPSPVTAVGWDAAMPGEWEQSINGADAVVNLTGESIGEKRWTAGQKQVMVDSRVNSTRALVETIRGVEKKPLVFVNASAVGFYGDVPEGEVEETAQVGTDFLGSLCQRWESEAYRAELEGVRTVTVRSGLVLAPHGGALAKLLPPFKLFVGGPLGSGRQWWPWIHLDDEIGIFIHAIEHHTVSGAVNATAPTPVRMKDFATALGRVLHRPSSMPTPAIALRLLLGEMADALLLSGQRAIPKKALETGYVFRYTDLEGALRNLIS